MVEGTGYGVYSGCATNVVLEWFGEVYPGEMREA